MFADETILWSQQAPDEWVLNRLLINNIISFKYWFSLQFNIFFALCLNSSQFPRSPNHVTWDLSASQLPVKLLTNAQDKEDYKDAAGDLNTMWIIISQQ